MYKNKKTKKIMKECGGNKKKYEKYEKKIRPIYFKPYRFIYIF